MNTPILSIAAMALTLVSAHALASGADGPQFPDLVQIRTADEPLMEAKMAQDAAQPTPGMKAPPASLFSADGPVYQPTQQMGAGRSRTEVKGETVDANTAGELGHATTPY